jgi:DNA topoisomerase I
VIARHPSGRLPIKPTDSAKAVGLRYVTDDLPGFRRQRAGKRFVFLDARGNTLRDESTLKRIRSLAIPPAWTDVWICPLANGHLQATGRDARGRKQHRYHSKWCEVRDETKYARMMSFAKALPKIRARIAKDLKLPGLPRNKVLATVAKLLEVSLIRVGNEEYAHRNQSYGLTTMLDRHAKVNGSKVQFRFRGKSGKNHTIDVESPRLARIVKSCQDLPGQELFQYIDENGVQRDIKSEDVNRYLNETVGGDFTAKDFRTWSGTVLAAMALSEFRKFDTKAQAKKNILRAIESVAERLGNTVSICRKCYIHPAVIDSYLDGATLRVVRQRAEHQLRASMTRLRPEEASVLTLLQQRVAAEANGSLLRHQLAASLKAQMRRKR